MQTPCIKVCLMDEQSGLCRGCGRMIDEIARWASMSDEERDAVMQALAGRMDRLGDRRIRGDASSGSDDAPEITMGPKDGHRVLR
ncbi:MAG: DUF1289 domain-containing protein [Alphaproteobacteria bacterium]|nr:DUF1289 domain-containing protein [Alphaproteobacteria bacterium]